MAFTLDPVPQETAEDVLALADVKAQLSIDEADTAWDGLLEIYRDTAVELVASYTSKLLRETDGLIWRGDFPRSAVPLELGVGPLIEVASITYLDASGNETTVDEADYAAQEGGSRISPRTPWPCGALQRSAVIEFSAGYVSNAVPGGLKLAAMQAVAYYFENREAIGDGTVAAELPPGARALCDRYRMPVL